MVSRLVPVDHDLGSARQRVPRDATAEQRVWRAAFDHPLLAFRIGSELARHRTVRFLDFEVDPGMWIHPLDFRDFAFQQYRLVRIELAAERVVRERRGESRRDQPETREERGYLRPHDGHL